MSCFPFSLKLTTIRKKNTDSHHCLSDPVSVSGKRNPRERELLVSETGHPLSNKLESESESELECIENEKLAGKILPEVENAHSAFTKAPPQLAVSSHSPQILTPSSESHPAVTQPHSLSHNSSVFDNNSNEANHQLDISAEGGELTLFPASNMKTFTLTEVASHSSPTDCFVIIHSRVYDITTYLSQHPGGPNLILKNAGKDCTSDFEGMFHSQKARVILERYCIGVLEGNNSSSSQSLSVSQAGKLLAWRNISGVQQGRYLSSNGNGSVTTSGMDLSSGNISSGSAFGKPPSMRSRRSASGTSLIHQKIYTKFQLISREPCIDAMDCFILKFKLQRPTARLMCPLGQHLQIRVPILQDNLDDEELQHTDMAVPQISTTDSDNSSTSQQQGQITSSETITLVAPRHMERKYTPTNISTNGSFELLVKCYSNTTPQTSVSHYLCRTLQYHDHVEMRGPFGTYQYQPNRTRYLGMMVCGSGITPVYRIIESIVQNRKVDHTKVILFYSNRSEKDIILRQQLEEWAENDSDRFQVHHVLSRPDEDTSMSNNTTAVHHHGERMTLDLAREHFMPAEMLKEGYIPNRRDFAALLCGTDGFVKSAMDICDNMGLNLQSQVHIF